MNQQITEMDIRLHSYQINSACTVDITLPEYGLQITDLKVMPCNGGGLQVNMPDWMCGRWAYQEISWAQVQRRISDYYRANPIPETDRAFCADFYRFDPTADREIPATLSSAHFRFYKTTHRMICKADVTIPQTSAPIRDVFLTCDQEEHIRVFMPKYMNDVWRLRNISWKSFQEQVASCFRAQILGREESADTALTVRFYEMITTSLSMVDAAIPGKRNVMKGFRLEDQGNGILCVTAPGWMKDPWQDRNLTWDQLAEMIRNAYLFHHRNHSSGFDSLPFGKNKPPIAEVKQKNAFGRIQDAANESPFRFVSHAVLRREPRPETDSDKSNMEALTAILTETSGFVLGKSGKELLAWVQQMADNQKTTDNLMEALVRGPDGGVGPTEIKIVSWVERMRYLTSVMLTDLFQGGYISRGWRDTVDQDRISRRLRKLHQYGLITRSRFFSVDEYGKLLSDKPAPQLVLTLGQEGATMLQDMGISTTTYQPFDIFQDGNTVKRYLSANQWLIYWMIRFPEGIGDNFDTARVVYQRGSEMQGARLYATVICNGCTMVAEPVRRVEAFETESHQLSLRNKFTRLLAIFTHRDELYSGNEKLVFPSQPVLVYVCEDDDHIRETWESVRDIAQEHPDQELWFTSDLRIYNYSMIGQRFLKVTDTGLEPVKLTEWIGTEETAIDAQDAGSEVPL